VAHREGLRRYAEHSRRDARATFSTLILVVTHLFHPVNHFAVEIFLDGGPLTILGHLYSLLGRASSAGFSGIFPTFAFDENNSGQQTTQAAGDYRQKCFGYFRCNSDLILG